MKEVLIKILISTLGVTTVAGGAVAVETIVVNNAEQAKVEQAVVEDKQNDVVEDLVLEPVEETETVQVVEVKENKKEEKSKNQEPVEWKETSEGSGVYHNGASEGYGDYVKGSYATVGDNGLKYFRFVSTSKLGCSDASDKQACKTYWINHFEPKVQSTKIDYEREKKAYDDYDKLVDDYKRKILATELETELCETEDTPACKSGEYSMKSEMLATLNETLNGYKNIISNSDSVKRDLYDQLERAECAYNEHLKALNIYKAL